MTGFLTPVVFIRWQSTEPRNYLIPNASVGKQPCLAVSGPLLSRGNMTVGSEGPTDGCEVSLLG
jgi:hypothetical protein